jgi:hypothetical protein
LAKRVVFVKLVTYLLEHGILKALNLGGPYSSKSCSRFSCAVALKNGRHQPAGGALSLPRATRDNQRLTGIDNVKDCSDCHSGWGIILIIYGSVNKMDTVVLHGRKQKIRRTSSPARYRLFFQDGCGDPRLLSFLDSNVNRRTPAVQSPIGARRCQSYNPGFY